MGIAYMIWDILLWTRNQSTLENMSLFMQNMVYFALNIIDITEHLNVQLYNDSSLMISKVDTWNKEPQLIPATSKQITHFPKFLLSGKMA